MLTFANGDKYDGEWKDHKKHGRGVVAYANGDKFEAEWKDDKRNGTGVVTYANGDKFEGEYKDDKRNGRGVITFANGDKFEGEFMGLPDSMCIILGKGRIILNNGKSFDGGFDKFSLMFNVTDRSFNAQLILKAWSSNIKYELILIYFNIQRRKK